MLLNQLIIQPRLRHPWSALDLGMLVAKRFWLTYSVLWLLLALPIFIPLTIFLPEDFQWLVIVIIWWLKPVFERPILYQLSQQLFGQPCRWSQTFAAWKQWQTGWLMALTLRRFSPARSFFMPVILLEKLSGSAYAKRTTVLNHHGGSQAFWLTIVLVHIESLLYFGVIILADQFYMGDELLSLFFEEGKLTIVIISNSIAIIAMAMVAPLYICGGFMLYISRRIELEAWDIEICFRDLADQLEHNRS